MITATDLQKALYKLGYLAGRNTVKKEAIPGDTGALYLYLHLYVIFVHVSNSIFPSALLEFVDVKKAC